MNQVKLGYYRKEDWARFIEIIDDKDAMHSDWQDWYKSYTSAKTQFEKLGIEVVEAVVDLDKLVEYCKRKGLKNTGKARAQFISQD
jgi:hypothetical protein